MQQLAIDLYDAAYAGLFMHAALSSCNLLLCSTPQSPDLPVCTLSTSLAKCCRLSRYERPQTAFAVCQGMCVRLHALLTVLIWWQPSHVAARPAGGGCRCGSLSALACRGIKQSP